MSADRVPPHLVRELGQLANINCSACYGTGIVTYTASNHLGYTEVRCACCGEPRPDPEPDDEEAAA